MEQKKLTGYPSIDKPWLKYYSDEAINAELPKCTIYENIAVHNHLFENDIAILYFGHKITYQKLFSEIEITTKALRKYDIGENDDVILCTAATPEAIYMILALNRLGANAIMLNPTFNSEQLLDRVRETKVKLFFVANELYDAIKNVLEDQRELPVISYSSLQSCGKIAVWTKGKKDIPYSIPWKRFQYEGNKTESIRDLPYKKARSAIVVYSSGTTGASKGIQLTNDGINATILQYEKAGFKMERQDRYLAQVPIWFSTGISVTMIVPLCLGITVMLEPLYNFPLLAKEIKKYKPNFFVTATGLLNYLYNNERVCAAYSKFIYPAIGGEYLTEQAEQRFNAWLFENHCDEKIHKGYGMCECGGTVTTTTAISNRIGSSGIPLPQVTVSAFDIETGKELFYGERGEIRVLSPCQMKGYYAKPDATAEYFHIDADGNRWACTGDMGYVDEDGNVYICGRMADSYMDTTGEKIFLFDIERNALAIDGVMQCKAVEAEVEGRHTHIVHFVTEGDKDGIVAKIQERSKEQLPDSYYPQWFCIYRDALPVASSGKLDIEKMRNNMNIQKYIN